MNEFKPTHQYIGGDVGMPDARTDVFPKNVRYVGESEFEGCGLYTLDAKGSYSYHSDKNYIKEL